MHLHVIAVIRNKKVIHNGALVPQFHLPVYIQKKWWQHMHLGSMVAII
jgi:hypothetical protein